MTGQLFINKKDAWLTWGVTLRRGSYDALRLGAPMKEGVVFQSSAQHGKSYLTEDMKVDEKQVVLLFFLDASTARIYHDRRTSFENELRKGLLEFKVPSLFTIYKLKLNNFNELTTWNRGTKATFAARFTEPNPTDRQSTLTTARILTDDQQRGLLDSNNRVLTEEIND